MHITCCLISTSTTTSSIHTSTTTTSRHSDCAYVPQALIMDVCAFAHQWAQLSVGLPGLELTGEVLVEELGTVLTYLYTHTYGRYNNTTHIQK